MLPAFFPLWLQDWSGAVATLKMFEIMNGSLFPLLFVIPVALVALLLAHRNGIASLPAEPSLEAQEKFMGRRFSDSAPNVRLPTCAPPAHFSQAVPAEPPLVMVADDSPVVRSKLSRLLRGAGFRVVEAGDGQQALDLLQRGRMPSVLITDLEMPTLDGFELIAAVHGAIETEHLPVIAITGHDALQARVADLDGLYGIFKKPWNDRALIRRVQTLATVTAKYEETNVAA